MKKRPHEVYILGAITIGCFVQTSLCLREAKHDTSVEACFRRGIPADDHKIWGGFTI